MGAAFSFCNGCLVGSVFLSGEKNAGANPGNFFRFLHFANVKANWGITPRRFGDGVGRNAFGNGESG